MGNCNSNDDQIGQIRSINVDPASGRRKISSMRMYNTECDLSDIKITERFVVNKDGELVFTKLFEPKDPMKAKAMILHSIGFSGNISWSAQDIGIQFAKLGFVTFMFDHKGHGQSDGDFVRITDYKKDLVDHTIWIFNYAVTEYVQSNDIYKKNIDEKNNYFATGHSMGGCNTVHVALQEQEQNTLNIKGIILFAPMIGIPPSEIPSRIILWIMKNVLLPIHPKLKLRKFGKDKPKKIEKQVATHENHDDPIGYPEKVPMITGLTLLEMSRYAQNNAHQLRMPMLILQGNDDNIVNVNMLQPFYDNYGGKKEDKMLKIMDGGQHALWKSNPEIFDIVGKWVMKYIDQ